MADLCERPMRRYGSCQLDAGHRGRCSTVAHYCDGCGKRRRSAPESVARNQWDGEVEAQFCWFCVRVLGPAWEREQYRYERDLDLY